MARSARHRIVRDIFRQRISAQIDISINRLSDGDADGVTIVRGQRRSVGPQDRYCGIQCGEPPRCGRLARRYSIGPSTCSRRMTAYQSLESSPLPVYHRIMKPDPGSGLKPLRRHVRPVGTKFCQMSLQGMAIRERKITPPAPQHVE